jgi:hypothetical protein
MNLKRWDFFMPRAKTFRTTAALVMTLCLGVSVSSAAKYAGEFLNFGLDARALGMGGAFFSLASGGFAAYWNPAGTAVSERQLTFNHSSNFDDLASYDALGYTQPVKNGGLGIVFLRFSVKDIPYTNDALVDLNGNGLMDPGERLDYSRITNITDTESALFLNYSRPWDDQLSLGANLKLISKKAGPYQAWGLGADLGALYLLPSGLSLGLNLSDISTTYLAWDTGTREVIIPTARAGFSWKPVLRGQRPLILALGLDLRFEGRAAAAQYHLGGVSADAHYGMEYVIRQRLSLRLGADQGRLAAGAGLRLGRLGFDYAYLGSQDLGSSTRISAFIVF